RGGGQVRGPREYRLPPGSRLAGSTGGAALGRSAPATRAAESGDGGSTRPPDRRRARGAVTLTGQVAGRELGDERTRPPRRGVPGTGRHRSARERAHRRGGDTRGRAG